MVGVPALPPLGVTAIDADLVEVEIYAGRRAVLDGDRTVIWNWTSAVFFDGDGAADGVAVPPPAQPADSAAIRARTAARVLDAREIMAFSVYSGRRPSSS
jgi:hypothetical protein